MSSAPPVVLTIAGSDPSGGAGLQLDLKVFADHGVYGAAAVTALTVQDTLGVHRVQAVEPELVSQQIEAVLGDLPVAAVKIGMLGELGVVQAVARALVALPAGLPVVLDPVLRSSSGKPLLEEAAVDALVGGLLPRLRLLTPNLDEYELLDASVGGLRAHCREQGVALLVKGGHGHGDRLVDRLWLADGALCELGHERVDTPNTHGTGCALSSAIAARLARGCSVVQAVRGGVDYLQALLRRGATWSLGSGTGPLPAGLRYGSGSGEDEG